MCLPHPSGTELASLPESPEQAGVVRLGGGDQGWGPGVGVGGEQSLGKFQMFLFVPSDSAEDPPAPSAAV